jgi:uncharacterized membrane protein
MFNFKLLVSALVLVIVDFIYLNLIKQYFTQQIKDVQQLPMEINNLAAIICYIFLIIGINYFIIRPNRSIQDAFLLGIIIYGVYETTNKALLKKWSWLTVIIDTLWGGILFAITTAIIKLTF